jgi:transposase-like protein
MECPYSDHHAMKYGTTGSQRGRHHPDILLSRRHCQKRFNERTGTQLANLRTPKALVLSALKIPTEGTGLRATGRILGKSHSTVIRCQKPVVDMTKAWSPPAPPSKEVTVKADELYTRVGLHSPPRNHPVGWTISFRERDSRYWLVANAGFKNAQLFQATQSAWQWAKNCVSVRWFTDGNVTLSSYGY